MHTLQLPTRYGQVAGRFGAAGEYDGVEFLVQGLRRTHTEAFGCILSASYKGRWAKLHPLGLHLIEASIDMRFLELEVGDAVTQQPTDTIILFKHRDGVPCPDELLSASQASRP